MGKCNLTKVRIGMSIVSIRSNTLKNLNYLYDFAELNPEIEIDIFNKTGKPFEDLRAKSNFRVHITDLENLYQTMSRLELESVSHVLWLNDDDAFSLPSNESLKLLSNHSVAFPEMSILTSEKITKIDWRPIFASTSKRDAFKNYWNTASPLFFCITPVEVFRVWISYFKDMELHLPHLDTQLNVLLAIQEDRLMLPNFTYTYGAENWESPEKLVESSLRFSRAFRRRDDFIYCMEIIRNIDNVCVLSAYSTACDIPIPKDLMREVLLQFSPMQNGRPSRIFFKMIIRNLLPIFFLRRLILYRMKDAARKSFILGLPKESLDFFLGSRILRSPHDLLAELEKENMADILMVPESMIRSWKFHLSRLIE